MLTTKSHAAALESLTIMGRLFFHSPPRRHPLKLRLFPLVAGPTGAGKSFLVEQVARDLDADYFKLTRGDWIVRGSTTGRSTVFQIIDRVMSSERLVLHIDELDKFQINFAGQEWSAAIGSDLWNTLDGKFQLVSYLADPQLPQTATLKPEKFPAKLARTLWIVGSGTWQGLFDTNRSEIGFGRGATGGRVDLSTIARSHVIHPELLHRFSGDLVFLDYPTRAETAQLLESTGINALASSLGLSVTPDDVIWQHGGMRALETLLTRLTVERCRREARIEARRAEGDTTAQLELRPS